VSDEDQEEQEEPRAESDRFEEVRAAAKRHEKRAKDLESEVAELRKANRAIGLRTVGIDPESYFGRMALDSAEANGLSDPEDVASLVRLARAEARGGN
jgi:hypothetical protein